MLKRYLLEDRVYWYEEGQQPNGAIELPKVKDDVSTKKASPKNKARGVKTK